jgi:hypothetical protein
MANFKQGNGSVSPSLSINVVVTSKVHGLHLVIMICEIYRVL